MADGGVDVRDWMSNLPAPQFREGDLVVIRGDGIIGKVADVCANVSADGYVYSVRPKRGALRSFVRADQLRRANRLEELWWRVG